MIKCAKEHLWLFGILICAPFCFHLLIWQGSSATRGDVPAYIPDWLLKIVPGITWGGLGAVISCLIAITLFALDEQLGKITGKAQANYLGRYAILYVVCWLIAFCFTNFIWVAVGGFADHRCLSLIPFLFFNVAGNVLGLFGFILLSLPIEIVLALQERRINANKKSWQDPDLH